MIAVCSLTTSVMVSVAAGEFKFLISKSVIVTLQLVLLLALSHADDSHKEDEFCPREARVDLTHAKATLSGFFDESGQFFPLTLTRVQDGVRHGCICDLKPCLALCPTRNLNGSTPVAEGYRKYSAIPNVYTTNMTLDENDETKDPMQWFHILNWDPCPERKGAYSLNPKNYTGDTFYLLKNGSLFLPNAKKLEARLKGFEKYCLRLEGNDSVYTPKVCITKVEKKTFNTVIYVGSLVSVPFLIATVIVYSVLSELNNIHGTTLRCYLFCLIITYGALAVSKMTQPYYGTVSRCFGFSSYFSFIASFLWLNVMSFDIWWKFSSFGSLQRSCANNCDKKFIYYSIYAWGMAVVLTAVCVFMEISPSIPGSIGLESAEAFYFLGPVGLTIASNICFFILTTIKIVQHNKNTRRHLINGDSKCHDRDKQWFSLHLKLFVVMGITWTTEVISGFWKSPEYLWYVMDLVNVLQGILIFVIFVCKKSIWLSLKERFKNAKLCISIRKLFNYICTSRNTSSRSSRVLSCTINSSKLTRTETTE